MNILHRKISRFLLAAMVTIFITGVWAVPAKAYVFTFNDEYLVRSGTALSSVFPGASGTSTGGLYQETNTVTPIITRMGGVVTSVPGEYQQNTTPNANTLLQLFGWGQSLNYGQQLANVYNLTDPGNGSVLYFRYTVGGATTPFTFNSLDLRGNGLTFTLQGFLGGVLKDSVVLTTTSSFTTYTENWSNIDTVLISTAPEGGTHWGSAALYMDNVVLNNDPPTTPEPSTMLLMGIGLVGSVAMRRRMQRNDV